MLFPRPPGAASAQPPLLRQRHSSSRKSTKASSAISRAVLLLQCRSNIHTVTSRAVLQLKRKPQLRAHHHQHGKLRLLIAAQVTSTHQPISHNKRLKRNNRANPAGNHSPSDNRLRACTSQTPPCDRHSGQTYESGAISLTDSEPCCNSFQCTLEPEVVLLLLQRSYMWSTLVKPPMYSCHEHLALHQHRELEPLTK